MTKVTREELLNADFKKVGTLSEAEKAKMNILLENTEKYGMLDNSGRAIELTEGTVAAGIDTHASQLMAVVRLHQPQHIGNQIAGVQPMKSDIAKLYSLVPMAATTAAGTTAGDRLFVNTPNSAYSGNVATAPAALDDPMGMGGLTDSNGDTDLRDDRLTQTLDLGTAMATAAAESLTSVSEIKLELHASTVEAKTRKLRAGWTEEAAQNLSASNGIDLQSSLMETAGMEMVAEENRELISLIYQQAVLGSNDTVLPGQFHFTNDTGTTRNLSDRIDAMVGGIFTESLAIQTTTRMGTGNYVIVSPKIAALLMTKSTLLDKTAAIKGFEVDMNKATFIGTINGMAVYVDPYQTTGGDAYVVGYKGAEETAAGIFYCPFVPLQMKSAVDANTFDTKVQFLSRYGIVSHPIADFDNARARDGIAQQGKNSLFRMVQVAGIK